MTARLAGLLALALLAPLFAACSGPGNTIGSAEEAFARGQEAFERRRFDTAAQHFRTALDFGRTTELAVEAQFMLARAHFENREFLIAANEYTRFLDFYRNNPRAEEAAFERIRAYYRLSPPFELDQTDTEQALVHIRQFLQQYPQSPRVPELVAMQEELREKLARKQFEAGRLYERRRFFEAAVITYRGVLTDYPTSAFADDAQLGMLRAQVGFAEASIPARQAERFREALAFYDRFTQLFPQSPLAREAEALYDRAFRGLRAAEAAEASAPVASGR
ncbi:MAG: outer membrane protein assembly factor BamD [Rubricoccaceae bacterium]